MLRRKNKRKSYRITSLIMALVFLVSCAGRAANPIMPQQYGDDKKSCKALEMGMMQAQQEIQLLVPKTAKTGKNVGLGIAGAFLIIPWFFMDFSQAEQVEVNALRQRYNHLAIIATDKNCGYDTTPIPAFDKKQPVKKEEADEDDEMF